MIISYEHRQESYKNIIACHYQDTVNGLERKYELANDKTSFCFVWPINAWSWDAVFYFLFIVHLSFYNYGGGG